MGQMLKKRNNFNELEWCRRVESNHWPHPYQGWYPQKKPIFISNLEWQNKKVVGKWLNRNNGVKSMTYEAPTLSTPPLVINLHKDPQKLGYGHRPNLDAFIKAVRSSTIIGGFLFGLFAARIIYTPRCFGFAKDGPF